MRPLESRIVLVVLGLALVACGRRPGGPAREHEHGHDHGPGTEAHAHGEESEAPAMALTLHSDTHELFVELEVPAAGREHAHHAHVTRLSDNAAASSGTFEVTFLDATGNAAATLEAGAVARTGIFTLRGKAPAAAGDYRLRFRYDAGFETAEWDGGNVTVGAEPVVPPQRREGDITFLKEQSWKLPFQIRRPSVRPIARHVVVAARVEPDPLATDIVPAPAAGRVSWGSAGSVTAGGSTVKAGDLLGRLIPSASVESWTAQDLALKQARIEKDRTESELARVQGLVERGLLADRRLAEARAADSSAAAALAAAQAEVRARTGREPGLELRAPRDGVVLELLVASGDVVRSGEPLARLASTDEVVVRGTVRGADAVESIDAGRAIVRVPGTQDGIRVAEAGGRALPVGALVDPRTAGVPVGVRLPSGGRLRIGQPVELLVAVGEPVESLTVPLSAVVEINTRPYAFVQVTGESFERRALTLGPSDGLRVAVLDGLTERDWVVTEGGFDVHVASLAGTVESHRH